MTRLGAMGLGLGLALALGLVGCDSNPLLKMAAADYQPLRPGTEWDYTTPAGAAAFSTQVLSSSTSGAGQLVSVARYEGIAGTSILLVTGAEIKIVSPLPQLDRKLPYVLTNSWDFFSGLGLTESRVVDGAESVQVPAGSFARCFRLKTEIQTYNSGTGLTTTSGTFIWTAPDVGDVQYADIDASGIVSITAQLSAYRPPS